MTSVMWLLGSIMLITALVIVMRFHSRILILRSRLEKKDRMIALLIRGLPILFVDNYKDPDSMKERDGSFVFFFQARPEYDSRFIDIKWICEGKEKKKYNSLILRYFYYLESLGLEVHPTLLGDRPYSGRVMLESYYELDEDETQTVEELKEGVKHA